jgi:hypothetical protein
MRRVDWTFGRVERMGDQEAEAAIVWLEEGVYI